MRGGLRDGMRRSGDEAHGETCGQVPNGARLNARTREEEKPSCGGQER